jgi:serine phosphatase RsbU (regulator of sigma subunit)
VIDKRNWADRFDFWRSMPRASHAMFLGGVFAIFLPAGVLTDIPLLGGNPPGRLLASALLSGALAITYVIVIRRWRFWIIPVVAIHVLSVMFFDRLAGPAGPPLTGDALRARLSFDVSVSTLAIVIGFVLFSHLIRREGTRYVWAHAEITLASDIHRLLVPRIERRIGRFEFRGVSFASGAVGGDLLDVVESPSGWTGYVADVSGHGVAAGLMMGMTKSTVRTQLRGPGPLESLLETSNTVLFDLKAPTMFVTFAGIQGMGPALRFTVAGHLPILRCSTRSNTVEELSISHLPLAMFAETTYTSSELPCAAGDVFVILTDGLTEVFDRHDREFGLDRVKSLLSEHVRAPLATIEERLLGAVRAHGAQLDDQTLLLIRVLEG